MSSTAVVVNPYAKMIEGRDPNLFKFAVKAVPTVVSVPALQQYIDDVSVRNTPAQEALYTELRDHVYGALASSRDESNFLSWLVGTLGSKKIIEVGVFLGVTTLALAQAIPDDGKIVALDILEEFTSVGQKYWKQAGVAHKIDLRIKPALESLKELADNPKELNSYDFAFIDADKNNMDHYYEYCLKLLRPGGIVAVDNVLWQGHVLNEEDKSESTTVIRNLNKKIHADSRVTITMLGISDGLTLCRKL